MNRIPKIILIILFFICLAKPANAQEEKWIFLPSTNLFKPLLADTREPNNSLVISSEFARYDLSLGGMIDFIQWKSSENNSWALGILGAAYLNVIRYDWASYRLEDSDLWYGFYVSHLSGNFSSRLEYRHGNSHLGDTLFGSGSFSLYDQTFDDQRAIDYERDLIQFIESYQSFDHFRIYGGAGYWLYAAPSTQPFFIHAGAELFSSSSKVIGSFFRGYFAYDLKIGDQVSAVVDQNFQLGVQLRSTIQNRASLRLALTYYNGENEFGQFYQQNDNHWGLGFFIDP